MLDIELTSTLIKGVFYASAIFIGASMITKVAGSAPAACKQMLRIQVIYYFVYFALIFPDLICSVYFSPFLKKKGFDADVISIIYICYQVSSIVGSLLCTPTLKILGTSSTLGFCCICKFVSVVLVLYLNNPTYAYISRLIWGFSYMLTKISLDAWLVDITQNYDLSQADRGILLNYRMVFQFGIDLLSTSAVSSFVIKHGLKPTYTILVVYYLAIIFPIIFSMKFLSKNPKAEEKPKGPQPKFDVPIETVVTVIADSVYVCSMGFFKAMLASNFIKQDYPFSVILSTFNAMGTLGTILTTFLESWFSDYTLHKAFLISYAVVFFLGWIFCSFDIMQFGITVALGLLDGLITPVMITLRKENIPQNIRVRALSSVRTFTSFGGFFLSFVMRYTNRQIYFLLISLMYCGTVALPLYQKPLYKVIRKVGKHILRGGARILNALHGGKPKAE